jgi:hypothetical protein
MENARNTYLIPTINNGPRQEREGRGLREKMSVCRERRAR